METALQRSLDRITKLRRLTRSTNKHEARAAFRQMRKLMDKVGVLYVADNDTVFLRLDETPPPAIIEPYLMQLAYVCATRWGCFAKRGAEGHLAVQGRRVSAEVALADYRDCVAALKKRCDRDSTDVVKFLMMQYAHRRPDDAQLRDLYTVQFYSEAVQMITAYFLPPKPAQRATVKPAVHAKIAEAVGKDAPLAKNLATVDVNLVNDIKHNAKRDADLLTGVLVHRVGSRRAPPTYVKSPLKKVPLGLPAVGQSTVPIPQMAYVRDRMMLLEID